MRAKMRNLVQYQYLYPFSLVDHEYVHTFEFGACEAQILRIKGQTCGENAPWDRSQESPVLWFFRVDAYNTSYCFFEVESEKAAVFRLTGPISILSPAEFCSHDRLVKF